VNSGAEVLVITGPTCTGKTALAIEVAEALDGEIISMDSRQVYTGMDIGTDKVVPPERSRVPHHGLDIRDPDQTYSAGQFARDARRWIAEIRGRGRVPILAGGTGFFLKAVTEPIFTEPELDPLRRAPLRAWLESQAPEELGRWIEILDPERAELARAGGIQRLVRSLELPLLTGRPLSWWHRNAPAEAPGVRALVCLLGLPREVLYEKINARVHFMVERGLEAEVRGLLDAGYEREAPGMTGTGYREVADYLSGECSLEEAVDATQRATRRYARRQDTWFRHQLKDGAVRLDAGQPRAKLVQQVVEAWTDGRDGA
jgi:tRNA dimethylallyltransferase